MYLLKIDCRKYKYHGTTSCCVPIKFDCYYKLENAGQ